MTINAYLKTRTGLFGLCWMLVAFVPIPVLAELNDTCVVSVLNRTVQVKTDGTWVLPNIPANFGPVRARATCVADGITQSGQSDFFTIPANGSVDVPKIVLGSVTPIPSQVTITAPTITLTQAGQTIKLKVIGKYADGSTKDVSAKSTGTQYLISNPALATVSADGLVTAKQSGTVVVQAIQEGTQGLLQINVALSKDSDGDGILDDVELRLGLDPNNPADAQDDLDRDGLTNIDEIQRGTDIRKADTDGDGLKDGDEVKRGTSPVLADTDGDGVPDNVEVATGSNPLDRNSINLARALKQITVTPANFSININTVDLLAHQQLTVTGEFTLGGTINLTSKSRGTNYVSSDTQVCNFGAEDGRVFGGQDGSCTITISNNGFTATARGIVTTFTPTALGFVSIPGFANNVDVSGRYAFVAAGSTGLQVVDLINRASPQVVATLDTPGNANDVVVVGDYAYVADDTFGLQIINIKNPLTPSLKSTADTSGTAWDVVVSNGTAFVADGNAGLKIINVINPAVPSLVGSIQLPGITKGVDVDLARNIVVTGGSSGIKVINVADRSAPVLVGQASGDVRDVVLKGNFAFPADSSTNFNSLDISNPASPVYRGSYALNSGGSLNDLAVAGNFASGANVSAFNNVIPIADISVPDDPSSRPLVNLTQLRADSGSGIAMDGSFIYLTGATTATENGAVGDSRLYIVQYRALVDQGGIAPTVSITSPPDAATVVQGEQITISAQADDDIAVASVRFFVNDTQLFADITAPYETTYTVPGNASNLTISATAVDLGGNSTTSQPVVVQAIPDPLTTLTGRVVNKSATPVNGATVKCGSITATTNAEGQFSVPGVATISGPLGCSATQTVAGQTLFGASRQVAPVRGGRTNLGDIVLSDARYETDLGTNLNQPDDTNNYIDFSGFSFPFYGKTYAGVYVNSNGRLTFSSGDNTYTENVDELNYQPQIATFFDDLFPPAGPTGAHGVYVKQYSDRFVVTWNQVTHYSSQSTPVSNTIQAVLFRDGRIQIGYNGIASINTGTIVGISPGNLPAASESDFSAATPFSVSDPKTIYEWFTGGSDTFDIDNQLLLFTPSGNGYKIDLRPLQ